MPSHYYNQAVSDGKLIKDPEQAAVLPVLDDFYNRCLISKTIWTKLKNFLLLNQSPIEGLYLWGDVGVGKTYLLDLLSYCVPKKILRQHFFVFMAMVHEKLKQYQGEKNPLQKIAKELSEKIDILCFDEFLVTNITDAMILHQLLKALFEYNISLIASSNLRPDDLYRDGLQRELFLPAIELIKQHTKIINIITTQDYRKLEGLDQNQRLEILHEGGELKIKQRFDTVSALPIRTDDKIIILNREIKTRQVSDNCIWFDFDLICSPPRGPDDYLYLSRKYSYIFISGVPEIDPARVDLITNFIRLIDILYDAKVKLMVTSDVPFELVYKKGPLLFEYQRTLSRLIEMHRTEKINYHVR